MLFSFVKETVTVDEFYYNLRGADEFYQQLFEFNDLCEENHCTYDELVAGKCDPVTDDELFDEMYHYVVEWAADDYCYKKLCDPYDMYNEMWMRMKPFFDTIEGEDNYDELAEKLGLPKEPLVFNNLEEAVEVIKKILH